MMKMVKAGQRWEDGTAGEGGDDPKDGTTVPVTLFRLPQGKRQIRSKNSPGDIAS
jgi:hypothetical protein